MDDFLGQGLTKLALLEEEERKKLLQSFTDSMRLNRKLFKAHAFRKSLAAGIPGAGRSVINISLFEVCSVLLSDDAVLEAESDHKAVKAAIIDLVQDDSFSKAITYSTNSTVAVKARFGRLRKTLEAALDGQL